MQVCFRQGLHSSQRAIMVSLHTPWDAFSFVSESLVSFRASYRRTRGQVSHAETTGFRLSKQARWCWAPHPQRQAFPDPATQTACLFPRLPPVFRALLRLEFPPYLALNVFSTLRPGSSLRSPQPLEPTWKSLFSDAALSLDPRIYPSLIPYFLFSTFGV